MGVAAGVDEEAGGGLVPVENIDAAAGEGGFEDFLDFLEVEGDLSVLELKEEWRRRTR